MRYLDVETHSFVNISITNFELAIPERPWTLMNPGSSCLRYTHGSSQIKFRIDRCLRKHLTRKILKISRLHHQTSTMGAATPSPRLAPDKHEKKPESQHYPANDCQLAACDTMREKKRTRWAMQNLPKHWGVRSIPGLKNMEPPLTSIHVTNKLKHRWVKWFCNGENGTYSTTQSEKQY